MATVDRKRAAKPREGGLPSPVAKKARPAPTAGAKLEKKMGCPKVGSRKPGSPNDAEDEETGEGNDAGGNHNKYCHFCQHVKVRASSMLACENQECSRRFCEHCLLTHLGEDVDPMSSDAWTMVNGKACWNCPICRSKCCCSVTECTATHRHCKAYRYRRRRAELALKRMAAMTDKRAPKKVTSKRPQQAATRPLLDISEAVTDPCAVDTPPTATAASWEMHGKDNKWSMEQGAQHTEAHQDKWSPVHSMVGTPPASEETARAEQERLQDQLLRGVWSHSEGAGCEGDDAETAAHAMPMLLDSNGEDEAPSRQAACSMPLKGPPHVQDSDDMMASVLGHMSEVTELDDASDVSDLDWPGVPHQIPHIDALIDQAEIRSNHHTEAKEVDEVEWLRRTYETVYNPTARQRALDQLLSTCGSVKRHPSPAARPHPRAQKCTVLYDFV